MLNLEYVLEDLKYAAKVIRSVRSGYVGLASRDTEGDWYLLGYQATPTRGGGLSLEWDLDEYPYYVCPEFGNGRHIPLPLVLGEDHDSGPIQRLALGQV